MIVLKPGVLAKGIQPELLLAVMVADQVYTSHGAPFVITSLTDGTHMVGSLHYTGRAVDIRTRDIPPSTLDIIVADIKERLIDQYDVSREGDHLHIEFDPHA